MDDSFVTLNINVDQQHLDGLMQVLSNLEPILMGVIAPFLQAEQHEIWESKGASVGEEWEPNKDSTEIRKEKAGWPLIQMVRTGNLRDHVGEILTQSGNAVSVGIDSGAVPYAEKHQYGDPDHNLPRRVLVSLPQNQLQDLLLEIAQYISERTGIAIDQFII